MSCSGFTAYFRSLILRYATCVFLYAHPRVLRLWDGLLRPVRRLTQVRQMACGILEVVGEIDQIPESEKVAILELGHPKALEPILPVCLQDKLMWRFRVPPVPPSRLVTLRGGRSCGADGAVITCNGRLLREYSGCFFVAKDSHPLMHRLHYPPVRDLGGTTVVLGFPKSGNYYHWLFDVLPRLETLDSRVSDEQLDQYLVDCRHAFQRESLQLLGIPLERCISPKTKSHYRCEKLLVPSLPRGVSQNCIAFLRNAFLAPVEEGSHKGSRSKRLYITRAGCTRRRVTNENEVIEALQAYGFECIDPARLSFAEQIATFRNADWIVAAHGGALSNLVFCQPDCRVIEIFSPNYVNTCFWQISCGVGLRYAYLLGEGRVPLEGKDPHVVYDDMQVGVCKLVQLVERMMAVP